MKSSGTSWLCVQKKSVYDVSFCKKGINGGSRGGRNVRGLESGFPISMSSSLRDIQACQEVKQVCGNSNCTLAYGTFGLCMHNCDVSWLNASTMLAGAFHITF